MSDFPYSAHIGYLFTDKPLRERIAAAKRHGFSAVEYPAPYGVPAQEMAEWLRAEGLPYTQFGLYSGDAQRGEKGLAIFPERREEFRRSVEDGLDYAEAIGVGMVHAMAGVLPAANRKQEHWDCYVENLAYAAGEAGKRGITILIEAMSAGAVPDYFIDTANRAAAAIAAAGGTNLGLLLDIFHTANMGLDIFEEIRTHAGLIAHVHIADYPGRHEPGSGSLDFDRIGGMLAEIGYRGRLGCEYVPAGDTEAGLAWLAALNGSPAHI
ncbi:hydroxypyruvate isomerase [Pseudaminobacter arsenicus]|uniref:Hydroxypyruvate isomerase n=1 Tax=Borborobacter arsenicus TaxID=1851146 RepID=A0A432V0C1_9HYPH|nr:TIM barrel protein [Pseudaminobacter arsenicus]RUM95611.1 hydroxypyruvate isomerase [Pseudaminobacter arsenicus]